jgi:hypothetical protein
VGGGLENPIERSRSLKEGLDHFPSYSLGVKLPKHNSHPIKRVLKMLTSYEVWGFHGDGISPRNVSSLKISLF